MSTFRQDGYLFVPGLTDTTDCYRFFGKLLEAGRGDRNDTQVPGSTSFYKEILFEKLLERLLPKIEALSGYELYKTYSYARRYELGNELKPHLDRAACEISATLALGYEGQIWPIWVKDKAGAHHSFLLHPGDALIFKGGDLMHWREINTYGPCSQVFLHYVDRHGPNVRCRDDLER